MQLWDPENPHRQRLQDEMNDELIKLQVQLNFVLRWQILSRREEWFAYLFVYDEAGRKISVTPYQELSTEVSDYPERLRTTSEILQFMCAVRYVNMMHLDLDEANKFYPLLKVYVPILDGVAPDFDKLRINVADYEEWDYVNPELDQDMERQQTRAKG